jgi:Predicted membrane protein
VEKTLQMKSDNKDAQMNKVLDNYFDRIAKALPRKGRKTLLPDIRAGVESYLAENPEAGIDDVVSYVGTPEDIAAEYYSNLDGGEITKEIKVGRKIAVIVLICLLIAALIFAAVIATDMMISGNGYFVTETYVISTSDVTPTDLMYS